MRRFSASTSRCSRAFSMAIATKELSAVSSRSSASVKWPLRLLTASMMPMTWSLTSKGTHKIDRVTNPLVWSTPENQRGSLVTSGTFSGWPVSPTQPAIPWPSLSLTGGSSLNSGPISDFSRMISRASSSIRPTDTSLASIVVRTLERIFSKISSRLKVEVSDWPMSETMPYSTSWRAAWTLFARRLSASPVKCDTPAKNPSSGIASGGTSNRHTAPQAVASIELTIGWMCTDRLANSSRGSFSSLCSIGHGAVTSSGVFIFPSRARIPRFPSR